MESDLTLADTTATITLGGNLTISSATQLKSLLMQGLEQAETVIVSFQEISDVDLSVIQLLCSAHRMSVRLNKRLLFGGNIPDSFRNASVRAGFDRHVGCALDSQKSCIWACISQRPVSGAA